MQMKLYKAYFSTMKSLIQRDQHFLNLLKQTDSNKISTYELSNIARVLSKSNDNNESTLKQFDEIVLNQAKNLDAQELRQVTSFYVMSNRNDKFVYYELNQRYKKLNLKGIDFYNRGKIHSFWLRLFGLRNKFINLVSKFSGVSLK